MKNPQTRWQIAVDPGKGVITFRLAGSEQQWRIDTTEIDYICAPTPVVRSLGHLPSSEADIQFVPLEGDQLADTLFEVLESASDSIGLPAELTSPIADAQVNALVRAE